jgi:hypothetical protein
MACFAFPVLVLIGCSATPSPISPALPNAQLVRIGEAASSYRVVYSFQGGTDGSQPSAPLVFADGKFYGTTGSNSTYASTSRPSTYAPGGTVFSLTAAGDEKVLHGFTYGAGGYFPDGGLLNVGNVLYGTTSNHPYAGTVYAIATDGSHYRVVYDFEYRPDGNFPTGTLVHMK